MKTTHTLRVFLVLLSVLMILPLFAACKKEDTSAGSTEGSTEPATEPSTEKPNPFAAPSFEVPAGASVYSGTPDTSWYTGNKTEYTLTSADQLVGFQMLRSKTTTFEGVTIKLACDVVINQGTTEEVKARGNDNHQWRDLDPAYLFKGNFDGQGHTISGVYLQLTGGEGYGSMFGSVAGNVTFQDFNLINSYFGTPTTGEDQEVLAGLITQITEDGSNVSIRNVNLDVSIEEVGKQFNKAAGYVGYVDGDVSLTIFNSICIGNISITGTHVGGFVAHIADKDAVIRITICTNYADLTTQRYCGGMIGQSKSQDMKTADCINRGKLNCKVDCKSLTGEHIILHDPYEGQPPEIAEGTTPVRVMSFNVQSELPKVDGVFTQAALNRIEAVKQEILYYSPDLLGLQEDSLNWITYLKLDDYNIIQDAGGAGNSTERCSIYYKKGMTLLDSGAHWLTHTGSTGAVALTYAELTDPNSKFYMTAEELDHLMITCDDDLRTSRKKYWDEKTGEFVEGTANYQLTTTRKMTYGVFDINGQTIIYINTHLTHRSQNAVYSNDTFQKIRSNARIKEWDILMGHLAEIQKQYPDALVFFTGDFNDNKETPIYNYITETLGYSSAEAATPEHIGPLGSWNNAFDLSKQGDCFPANQGKENTTTDYLDYCFFGEGLTVKRFIVGAGKSEIILKDGSEKTIYTSDHLPIITDFSFKTQTTGTHIKPESSGGEETPSTSSVYSGLPDSSWYTGDKTEYILTTADQLMGFQELRSENVSFKDVTIKLACDMIINEGTMEEIITRSSANHYWKQIASSNLFLGTFDGQGHTISGIYMQLTTSAVRGMFGGVSGNAVIKNLNIQNCYFGGPSENKNTLGCLIARITGNANVTISNVNISNATMEEKAGTLGQIGGFVGYVEGGSTLTMENCSFGGSIKFATKGSKVGGFVGAALKGATVTLNKCTLDATVEALSNQGDFVGYEETGSTVTKTDCTTK